MSEIIFLLNQERNRKEITTANGEGCNNYFLRIPFMVFENTASSHTHLMILFFKYSVSILFQPYFSESNET